MGKEKIDSIIRIKDIAWVRMQSPDLDQQQEFLEHFGLAVSDRTDNALYCRGTDPDHHIHITEKGEPGVISFAYWAESEDDLHKLSREAEGASDVEDIDEPGGGKRVWLKEPNGLGIEVVYGVDELKPLDVPKRELNFGPIGDRRKGELMRVDRAPARVKRIAHGVFKAPDVDKTVEWFQRHLGLIRSDDVFSDDNPDVLVGSFCRPDQGKDYVDHHVLFVIKSDKSGFQHVSFEVQDLDDVLVGHEYMREVGKYEHMWGIGRHLLGSQIFDYWKDPWGRVHEHWTDSDRLNIENEYNSYPASEGLRSQWGPQAPEPFREALVDFVFENYRS